MNPETSHTRTDGRPHGPLRNRVRTARENRPPPASGPRTHTSARGVPCGRAPMERRTARTPPTPPTQRTQRTQPPPHATRPAIPLLPPRLSRAPTLRRPPTQTMGKQQRTPTQPRSHPHHHTRTTTTPTNPPPMAPRLPRLQPRSSRSGRSRHLARRRRSRRRDQPPTDPCLPVPRPQVRARAQTRTRPSTSSPQFLAIGVPTRADPAAESKVTARVNEAGFRRRIRGTSSALSAARYGLEPFRPMPCRRQLPPRSSNSQTRRR